MAYCLIFPGQGTQFPGMSAGFGLKGVVDPDLLTLMEQGPEEDLNRTVNAQPAVLAASIALWRASGLDAAAMVMGHSLGEYTALVASGALTLADGIRLVAQRGAFMEASEPGSMAAVMGLSAEDLTQALARIRDVWIANLNGSGQVVISGRKDSMQEALAALKARKAKVVPLKVSVASHCPLMAKASAALAGYLTGVNVQAPRCTVVFNATARTETDPQRIKGLLADQLVSPVRWAESVAYTLSQGITHFIEIGPKSVLAGMVKRLAPDARVEMRTVI